MRLSRKQLQQTSALYSGNGAFLESLYEAYLLDPERVDPSWREHFEALHETSPREIPHGPIREHFRRLAGKCWSQAHSAGSLAPLAAEKQAAVLRLINAYRYQGHRVARLDPLQLRDIPEIPDLDPAYYRLDAADLDQIFHTGSLYAPDRMRLRDILHLVREIYCGPVGSEYMHITDTREKRWIQKRLEGYRAKPELDAAGRRWLLQLLSAAEGFERYLHLRYVGQKRFSLEGGETLIPLLDELIQRAGRKGIREIVLGMTHRGRLNVLVNILGKPLQALFSEFEECMNPRWARLAGDVKYHLGFSTDIDTPGGALHLALGFNPSHLEIIDPVIEGSVRARQRRRRDHRGEQVLPLLIHGDSAFAGQGVVAETLQLSQTRGFSTGGTLHLIINNQIGFTTSNPLDTRSSPYCTDLAKMVQAPVFHVNGDDPEAAIFVTRLALDYRNQFHKDVVVDLVCYRRLGHNEADEPAVTQPKMYQRIRGHPSPRVVYGERLIAAGVICREEMNAMMADYRRALEQGVVVARPVLCQLDRKHRVNWQPYRNQPWDQDLNTGVPREKLQALARRMLQVPEGFQLHPRVAKLWEERERMAEGTRMADWGFCELLAYATLVDAGYGVRLSGQDCSRGTFFHRHATLHDQKTGASYTPLQHLSPDQAPFTAIDSLLSEEAVLGFEYGYATAEPRELTLWEAQFGDFANVAQVVIDQFISSAGTKWDLYCGLVLLLPHGLEGQGAEHSSARLERFLQLCAEENMQVCVPTTPAQMFHLLRRQMLRPYRRPLIVLTPKSLLRHRLATSRLEELEQGGFQTVLGEDDLDPAAVQRVILCTGKIYFELLEARSAQGLKGVALIRLEQLYPFPKTACAAALRPYARAAQWIWCQEEPRNQGAWQQIKDPLQALLGKDRVLRYVGRPDSAVPAVGYRQVHLEQQAQLIETALCGSLD